LHRIGPDRILPAVVADFGPIKHRSTGGLHRYSRADSRSKSLRRLNGSEWRGHFEKFQFDNFTRAKEKFTGGIKGLLKISLSHNHWM
jgi:hypothetical protein